MTELEYMEKIEALRTQGRCSTSPDSARRYAAQLRAGSDLSQAFAAEAEGWLKDGRGVLDLNTPQQLERLNVWQGMTELSDRERAAVELFLRIQNVTPLTKKAALQREARREEAREAERIAVEESAGAKRPMFRETSEGRRKEEPPLSLYGLLAALQRTTKNRRSSVGTPTYTLLMQVLLLNENFFWSSDSTERHLRRWGGNYYENSQVILANLHNEQRREDVKRAMRKALHKMEDESVGPELRLDVARACVALEEEMEQRKAPVPSGDGEDPHGKANRGLAARCPKGGRAGTAVDRLSGGVGGDAVQPTGEPGNLRVRRTGKGKQCSFTVSGTACRNRTIR